MLGQVPGTDFKLSTTQDLLLALLFFVIVLWALVRHHRAYVLAIKPVSIPKTYTYDLLRPGDLELIAL